EADLFKHFVAQSLTAGMQRAMAKTQEFMKTFPDALPDVAIQHWASIRKASRKIGPINASRPAAELLGEMIEIHMENVAVAALASFMRRGGFKTAGPEIGYDDPFAFLFSALLGHSANSDEIR